MKYVFVDMDGVIAEYGYPSGKYDGEFQKGNYLGKKPVEVIINEIISKYNNKDYVIMICSASPNAKATIEKNDWLNNNFGVPYENRIFIHPDEDKIEVIRYYIEDLLHGNIQTHAIIIDDKGTILAKAKSLGIECYHPSQIIALKEQREKEEEQKAREEQERMEQEAEQQRQMEEQQRQEEEQQRLEQEQIGQQTEEVEHWENEENNQEETPEENSDDMIEIEVPENLDGQMTIEDLQKLIDEQTNNEQVSNEQENNGNIEENAVEEDKKE